MDTGGKKIIKYNNGDEYDTSPCKFCDNAPEVGYSASAVMVKCQLAGKCKEFNEFNETKQPNVEIKKNLTKK